MEELIQEGQDLISIVNIEKLKDRYDTWCQRVMILLRTEGFSKEDQHEFIVKAHYTNNEFFPVESQKSILNAIKDATAFLDSIKSFTGSKISEETALTIVERILKNFYMYYQAMYRDLQRMIYSILLPIFPTVRQEVNSDNGYGGMRADIYLKEYSLIIETKCTRESMTEKRLLEELGADSFHYKAKTLFIFVFDKKHIIKNPVAFEKAFKRDKEKDGKTVRLFIAQKTNW